MKTKITTSERKTKKLSVADATFEKLIRPKVLPYTLENRRAAFRSAMKATFAVGFNNGTY